MWHIMGHALLFKCSAYFMWASAVLGSPGSDTELSSPKITLTDRICFTFWLDMTVRIALFFIHHCN